MTAIGLIGVLCFAFLMVAVVNGTLNRVAGALEELVRIAQREHGIRELERARRDEAKAGALERRPLRR